MFGINENEAKALSNEYNFGPLESANNQNNTHKNQDVSRISLQEVSIKEEDPEVFSSDEGGNHMANCVAYYAPENDGAGSPSEPSPSTKSKNGKKKESKLTAVISTLGVKKESKGLSAEEKERISLERRWKRSLDEEQRLNELESRLNEAEQQNHELGHEPNFPPKFLCIKPIVYYSLDEVPDQRKRFVSMAYWCWVALIILLVINAVVSITIQYAPLRDGKTNKINKSLNIFFALLSLLGIPLSFFVWFWPVYRSCSTGNPSKYHMAFFGLVIALAHAVLEFFGPLNLGMSGIFLCVHIGETRKQVFVIPAIIVLFLWLFESILICFIIVKLFIFYRKDLQARRVVRRQIANVVGL